MKSDHDANFIITGGTIDDFDVTYMKGSLVLLLPCN